MLWLFLTLKMINTGQDLLEIFENVTGSILRHSVEA